MTNVEYVKIEGFKICKAKDTGIHITGDGHHITIDGNHIHDIAQIEMPGKSGSCGGKNGIYASQGIRTSR